MKGFDYVKKRSFIRATSFAICLVAIISIYAIKGNIESERYKSKLEAVYQQNLNQLASTLDEIETSLEKSEYATSGNMMNTVSSDLYSQCLSAKSSLAALPVDQLNLTGAYKFLSQAGDYARYLSQKDELTEEDYDNLHALLEYAQKYSDFANSMLERCAGGAKISENQISSSSVPNAKVSAFSLDFNTAEEAFENYPTLLYDGPYADAVLNKEPEINNAKEYSKEECQKIAADLIGAEAGAMLYRSDDNGNIPAYVFSYKYMTVAISKHGGRLVYIISDETVSAQNTTEENAINAAKEFLNKAGYDNMAQSYYAVYDNICVINFAYSEGGIIYYPDLIKVGVSLETGRVYSFEAFGFLTNHTKREAFEEAIGEAALSAKLPSSAAVVGTQLCVIPKENGKEVACREFHCISKLSGDEALLYFNAKTGAQEEIMLLLYSDNGVLTK